MPSPNKGTSTGMNTGRTMSESGESAGCRVIRGLAGAIGLWWLMCVLPGLALAHGPTIEISHGEMKPPLLNLFVGTTVHFANTVEMPGGHVVVDEAGRIESPPLVHPGDGWHHTFDEEGVYELFVRQHPAARARVVVVPRPATPGR